MHTIWRVQNSEGMGPYHGLGSPNWTDRVHTLLSGHPSPYEDLGLASFWRSLGAVEGRDWKFGFESLEQLKRWFSQEELMALEQHGFTIVQLQVNKVQFGTHQVVFIPCELEPLHAVKEEVDYDYEIVPF